MAERGPKNTRAVVVTDPNDRLSLAALLTDRGGERPGRGPDLLYDIEFVLGRGPGFGEAFHDGMIFGGRLYRIIRHVVVITAGDAEEFAPVIELCRAVGVHRAVDDHGWFAGLVRGGDR